VTFRKPQHFPPAFPASTECCCLVTEAGVSKLLYRSAVWCRESKPESLITSTTFYTLCRLCHHVICFLTSVNSDVVCLHLPPIFLCVCVYIYSQKMYMNSANVLYNILPYIVRITQRMCRLQSGVSRDVERWFRVVHVRSANDFWSHHQGWPVSLLCQYTAM